MCLNLGHSLNQVASFLCTCSNYEIYYHIYNKLLTHLSTFLTRFSSLQGQTFFLCCTYLQNFCSLCVCVCVCDCVCVWSGTRPKMLSTNVSYVGSHLGCLVTGSVPLHGSAMYLAKLFMNAQFLSHLYQENMTRCYLQQAVAKILFYFFFMCLTAFNI